MGNKLDLAAEQRVVDEHEARSYASDPSNGMSYFETSAKSDIGVKEMMQSIMEQTY